VEPDQEPKEPVMIGKEIWDHLGNQPEWQPMQVDLDGHATTVLISAPHNHSLLGAAKPFIRRRPELEEDWDDLIGKAIAGEWRQKWADQGE
jgi:hypothetical protein